MADAADAITNGFAAVFGCLSHRGEPHPKINNIRQKCRNFKRGMCYFHVKQAIEHKLHMIKDKSVQKDILYDIKDIQRSQSNVIFKTAIDIFKTAIELFFFK